MLPVLRPGQVCVFVRTKNLQPGQVVLAHHADKDLVKRVSRLERNVVDLVGDNHQDTLRLTNIPLEAVRARLLWPRLARAPMR